MSDVHHPFNDPKTHEIIGAAIEVHRKMGCGFLEAVYPECLIIEFQRRKIPYRHQLRLYISYDGVPLNVRYRADFVCYDSVIVEVKALPSITGRDVAQAMNYLRATRHRVAIILNFGGPKLETRRVVWDLPKASDPLGTGTSAERPKADAVHE